MAHHPGAGLWALAREVNRFLAVLWPRWKDREHPPEGCSELRYHLFCARKAGTIPESARHLHEIATK